MTEEAQASPIPPQAPVATPSLSDIGGWMVLPLLGLIATPISEIASLIDARDILSNIGSLPPLQSNVFVLETIFEVALLIVAPIPLLVMLFEKRRKFPLFYIRWIIAVSILAVVTLMASYVALHAIYEANGTPFLNLDTLRTIIGPAIGLCVWIPYMLKSVRVKNTFVN